MSKSNPLSYVLLLVGIVALVGIMNAGYDIMAGLWTDKVIAWSSGIILLFSLIIEIVFKLLHIGKTVVTAMLFFISVNALAFMSQAIYVMMKEVMNVWIVLGAGVAVLFAIMLLGIRFSALIGKVGMR